MKTKTSYAMSAAIAAVVLLSACGGAAAPTSGRNAQSTAADAPGSIQLNASGATFPQPLYEDWAFAYSQIDPSVVINYGGGGSGQGIKDIKAGNVDFAGSDAPLTDKDYQDKAGLQMLPSVAGAVVLAYNVKGITSSITLNNDVVAGIYLGKIEKWSDPAIATLNPGVQLPDTPINVVHRSDGSGT